MADITQINDKLWTVNVDMPDYSVRGAVIVGDDTAVVWDTLLHPGDMYGVNEIIGNKPYYVVYTHADWDHIWGTAGLTGTPLSVIAQTHCRERFSTDVPKTLKTMQANEPERWDDVQLIPPNLTFETQMTLHLGGVTLALYHLAGHTEDCIVGWLPEMGILLGGDVMETPLPVVNDGEVVEQWLADLQQWSSNKTLQQTIPAHGTTNGCDCLDSSIVYLQNLLSDDDFPMPENLDDFYRKTHTQNLELVRDR